MNLLRNTSPLEAILTGLTFGAVFLAVAMAS